MKLKRVQFYVTTAEWADIALHCLEKDRSPGNLAHYALRRYMQQYPLKKRKGISIPKKRK